MINNFTYSFSHTHILEHIKSGADFNVIQEADSLNSSNCTDDEDFDLRTYLINQNNDKDDS